MQNYGKLLDFMLLEREANSRAFETAKHYPFLFLFSPPLNESAYTWQPLLFNGMPEPESPPQDTPIVLPDSPVVD
jgi:hypothetical protein